MAVGVGLAIWAGRAASSLLYGLKRTDPVAFVVAGTLLGVAALAASYVPARRAARLDAMQALREE